MNENEIKRRFPHASKAFIEANLHRASDPGGAGEPKPLAGKPVEQAGGSEKMGEEYCLRHVGVEFFAGHGQKLDEDNRRFVVKPILDALVRLNFARDDKNITSKCAQRMDKTHPDI